MIDHLFAKLERRDRLGDDERGALQDCCSGVRRHAPRDVIVAAGVPQTCSNLLLEGYVARARTLADGQRQIIELHVPGDFIDLPSFLLKEIEHDIVALTDVRIGIYPHDRLTRLTETRPHLVRMLWLVTQIEAAAYREAIVTVGRRDAAGRVAHLLCELYVRQEVVGLAAGGRMPFPFTQADIGDATGLTAVHVNRMLRRLREQGLIETSRRELAIRDFGALAAIGHFDPAYLYLERRPR